MHQEARALAQYLHERQWAANQSSIRIDFSRRNYIHVDFKHYDSSFFKGALRKLKTNKAPGPDGAISELFRFLDSENVASLTRCLNTLWNAKYVPDDFAFAYIASLYKKGNHDNPENYRPISLLNTAYKLHAYMITVRLAAAIDLHLGDTQFGFRRGKSTAEALFCVRRLTDVVEQGHERLFLIFLKSV